MGVRAREGRSVARKGKICEGGSTMGDGDDQLRGGKVECVGVRDDQVRVTVGRAGEEKKRDSRGKDGPVRKRWGGSGLEREGTTGDGCRPREGLVFGSVREFRWPGGRHWFWFVFG